MSEEYPEVLLLTVGRMEGLHPCLHPYLVFEVAERRAPAACPAPRTRAVACRPDGCADWPGPVLKVLLRPGDAINLAVTVWDETQYGCDRVLGRGTVSLGRQAASGEVPVVQRIAMHGGRALFVSLAVQATSVLEMRGGKDEEGGGAGGEGEEGVVAAVGTSVSNAMLRLSRFMLSCLVRRLRAVQVTTSHLQAALGHREAETFEACRRAATLEGLLAARAECARVEEAAAQEAAEEQTREVHAAVQAMEAKDEECEAAQREGARAERECARLRRRVQELEEECAAAEGRCAEGAAVDVLLGGGVSEALQAAQSEAAALRVESEALRRRAEDRDGLRALLDRYLPQVSRAAAYASAQRGVGALAPHAPPPRTGVMVVGGGGGGGVRGVLAPDGIGRAESQRLTGAVRAQVWEASAAAREEAWRRRPARP